MRFLRLGFFSTCGAVYGPRPRSLGGEMTRGDAECVYRIEEVVTHVAHLLPPLVNFLLLSMPQHQAGS